MAKYRDVDGYVWGTVGLLSLRAIATPKGEPIEGDYSIPGDEVQRDYGPLTLIVEEESK